MRTEATSSNFSTFDEWLNGREVPHLSTNAGAAPVAFQSWRNFKEAFAPELIGRTATEVSKALGRPVINCIDPFGGSGTSALAAQFLDIEPFTIEVNPFLADLIEAKLSTYDSEQLISDFDKVINAVERPAPEPYFPGAPRTFVEPGVEGRYLFNQEVADAVAQLRNRIFAIRNAKNKRLLRVLLGSISTEVSNIVVSGKGRRYRTGWQHNPLRATDVYLKFEEVFLQALYDVTRYKNRATSGFQVICGDARSDIPSRRKFDLAVFLSAVPKFIRLHRRLQRRTLDDGLPEIVKR